MIHAKVWYFLTSGGSAFLLPFLNVYFQTRLGFSPEQIGALSALRPWLSAPCGAALCAAADRAHAHRVVLIGCFAACIALRSALLALPQYFLAVAALMLVSDCIGAPVGAIVDAAVVAGCASDGDYGRHRVWGSIGWGGLSLVAGSLFAARGIGAGLAVYLALSVPCVVVAWRLSGSGDGGGVAGAGRGERQEAVAVADVSGKVASPGKAPEDGASKDELLARLLPSTPRSCGASHAPTSDGMRGAGAVACVSPFSRPDCAALSSGGLGDDPGHIAAEPGATQHDLGDSHHSSGFVSGQAEAAAVATAAVIVMAAAPKTPARLSLRGSTAGTDLAAATASEGDVITCDSAHRRELAVLSPAQGADASDKAPAVAAAPANDVSMVALLAQPAVLILLWRATVIGLGLGTIGTFLFLYVEQLGGDGRLMGLMLAANCVTEVPAFQFQSRILARLPVPVVFNLSMLLLAARLACYAALPWLPGTPWPVLAVELMHGCTFASSWGAGIVACKRLAPPLLNASMQGLFAALYGGVGVGLGALLGGWLMRPLGGAALFLVTAAVVLGGWLIGAAAEAGLALASRQPATARASGLRCACAVAPAWEASCSRRRSCGM